MIASNAGLLALHAQYTRYAGFAQTVDSTVFSEQEAH